MTSEKRIERTARLRSRLRESGYTKRATKTIHLTCAGCGSRYDIDTNSPEMYTPEIRGRWVSLQCCGVRRAA